ncbi:hypothetical protein MSSD14B_08260 [Marinobacter salsuginis]|uniref:Uncharacterized protein n=2 Tax=Marinobacter salsuginis TaxID=418719 RepID=A0A5M3PWC0_9GAMM|nr:hypothetical protein MSSD14B_08260 [Marinobacter salsuginis]
MPRLIIYGYSGVAVFGAIAFTLYGSRLDSVMVGFWMIVLAGTIVGFKKEFKVTLRFALGIIKWKSIKNSF